MTKHVPAFLQLVGACTCAFAIGGLAGWWYACASVGVGMLSVGTLAEIEARKVGNGTR